MESSLRALFGFAGKHDEQAKAITCQPSEPIGARRLIQPCLCIAATIWSHRDNVALLTAVDVLPAHQGASSVKATGPAADNGDNFAGKSKEDSKESDDDESPYQKEPRVSESSPDAGVSRVPTPILDEDGDGEADKGGPSEGSAVPIARLVIANTHLLFNPKRGDIKMAQLMMLTASVER